MTIDWRSGSFGEPSPTERDPEADRRLAEWAEGAMRAKAKVMLPTGPLKTKIVWKPQSDFESKGSPKIAEACFRECYAPDRMVAWSRNRLRARA